MQREEQKLIAAQMGRKPRGVVAVAARCPAGHPAVVTCHPLRHCGERVIPFPTLYWLTCPALCTEVSHLERDGVIAALEADLARDPKMQAAFQLDHEDYIARRWAVLTPAEQLGATQNGRVADLQTRGIGGMVNRAAVKCLHLHLAHHLVTGNILGRLLVERHGVCPCPAS